MMRHRKLATGDDGTVMLMALAFVMVIGLVIGALLTQSATQFKAERAFREQREGVFAADAGLEYAVAGIGMVPGTVEDTECTSTVTSELVGGANATSNVSANLTINSFPISDIRGQQGFVIVAASLRGAAANPQATLGTVTMTRLTPVPSLTASGRISTTVLFYVLEANLPAGNSATITLTGAGTVPRVLYASRWTGVAQEAPTYASNTGASTSDTISTSVNAPAAGALVFSAAATSFDGSGMDNSGAGTRLVDVDYNPSGSNNEIQFGASYRIASSAGSNTVVEDFGVDANPATHVVLSAKDASTTSTCPTTPSLVPGSAVQGNRSGIFSTSVTLEDVELSVPAGRNRLVVVAVHGASTAGSVTFNGTTMTLGRRAATGSEKSSVWYLLDAQLPAPGDYDVQVTSSEFLDFFPTFAVHASAWTGVLQGFGPTGLSSVATSGSMSSITTGVDVDTPGGLVFSAAGHDGASAMAAPTGAARLTGGSTSSGAFGTSWAVAADATAGYQVTEAFSGAGTPTTHILLAFRPASWAPLVYGGNCETGIQGPFVYNDYNVTVHCVSNGPGDALTITSTATAISGGRVIKAHATVSRLPSGTIEITEWDTRPSDSP